ncbi:hypothetical protein ZIOFF_020305 [Zingiber officinale]|uniref:SOSEKI DIX-like domain-containing protein n=1 Tax=Zingiber officinale TaxID=94328 RepID=A0A8J5H648_ZINOF|nr:hypothetical protein ZIOFF_020305 [Zingiber officinale]
MEARMRRYAPRSSPERTKVWTEPPAKHQLQQQGKRVPVVYYLCRNRHLEHPHFVEVPLSSPDGLFLRDVIDKLNAQRGKRMAAMSYKNGFVWHDLSEDDLILPAHGNEYVLKGSEILDQTPPDRRDRDSSNAKIQNMKNNSVQEPPISCKNQEASFLPSSAEVLIKVAKLPSPLLIQPPPPPQEDDPSSSIHVSPEPGRRTSLLHEISSPKPAELRIQKPFVSQDASTQTEDRGGRRNGLNTRIMGVSTDDKPLEVRYNRRQSELTMRSNEESEIVKEESLPSSTVSSSAKTNTLESLIREEVSLRNNYKNGEAEEVFLSTGSKFRATNMLMHMFTCGSISVKDHYGIGFAADYKPRLSDAKFTSPMPSTSVALQEISFLPESQRAIVPRLNKKQHFSGSMIETNKFKERRLEGVPKLKRSSSFNEDRSYDMPCSTMESEKIGDSSQPKYPSRASKNISNMSSMFDDNATKISPVSDARKSSAWMDIPRLTSGARVIIVSRSDDNEDL